MKNIRDEVAKMSSKDIILTMLDAIKNPITDIFSLNSFGRFDYIHNIVTGGAPLNFMLKILGDEKIFYDADVSSLVLRAKKFEVDEEYLNTLEHSISCLVGGNLKMYNNYAQGIKIAQIKPLIIRNKEVALYIPNNFEQRHLSDYEKLAYYQV